jgi:protein-L-isoaspartate(D-aspartate) O-methyltransferase
MRLSSEMRRRLVEQLRRGGYLHDRDVMAAFRAVPREVFLPEQLDRLGLAGVYRDDAIVTRRDPATRLPTSSSSQPAIMALMLEMLDLRPGQRVVEIGTGTGYNAAILERLVGPQGQVVTVDIDAGVARPAARALRSLGLGAHVVVADGTESLPLHGPVDRIEVTASGHLLPRAWHDQLGPEGRLVVPLRLSDEPDRAHAVTAFAKVPGGFDSVRLTPGGFMPLRRRDGSPVGSIGTESPAPAPAQPQSAPSEPEMPKLSRGPAPGISRDDLQHLLIRVRYGDCRRRQARWAFERGDQWIGIDLADPLS